MVLKWLLFEHVYIFVSAGFPVAHTVNIAEAFDFDAFF